MSQLTDEEFVFLKSQNATLKTGRGRHRKYLPSDMQKLATETVFKQAELIAEEITRGG